MKTTFATVLVLLTVFSSLAQCADPPSPQFPGPYPVDLQVGEIFNVCKIGEIICPARYQICDDLKVADIVDTPDGLGFRGVGLGTTLCAAGGNFGPRRVFRITVH